MDRAGSQCLVAVSLTVARTHRQVAQASASCRALGSDSYLQAGVGGTQSVWQWQQQGVCIPRRDRAHSQEWCSVAVPSSELTSKLELQVVPVQIPNGVRPQPPLVSEMTAVVCPHCG